MTNLASTQPRTRAPAPVREPRERDAPPNLARLRGFLQRLAALVEQAPDAPTLLPHGQALLAELVCHDDWLPDAFAQPHPEHYQQYLLHADALGRFSVVSFVWGPGQQTPIHDHTVWGLIGMLRGSEHSQPFVQDAHGRWQPQGEARQLLPGDVEAVCPPDHDVHQVRNAFADRVSISIHVYGANIGGVRRHVFAPDGEVKPFVSGYSNRLLPNLWDLSQAG
jgi:predicted metal-dependent enzyme (double-stranded beta helix superfamily)